jgi:hypothetical protein
MTKQSFPARSTFRPGPWTLTLAVCLYPNWCPAQGPVLSDTAPAAFQDAFRDAQREPGDRSERALARLAGVPDWEPYFRVAFNRLTDQRMRDRFRPALEKCRARLIDWNLERGKEWAKELRFDYVAALAAQIDDTDKSLAVGGLAFNVQKEICDKFRKVGNFRANSFLGYPAEFADFVKKKDFRHLSGDRVRLPKKPDDPPPPTFLHVRALEIEPAGFHSCLTLVQDPVAPQRETDLLTWSYSVLVVNAGCRLTNVSNSLVVCDGDLEFQYPTSGCSHSVVVCNGTITVPPRWFELGDSAILYAAGDFVGKEDAWHQKRASVLAGGKNASALPKDDANAHNFRGGVKEIPFGIKFVSPADAGVELKLGEGVVYLGKLADTSPLAKHGLESGDWVKTLNGVPILNAPDFRRQLRESLLWGTGLFEVKRGDQTFVRLVRFAEPPKAR